MKVTNFTKISITFQSKSVIQVQTCVGPLIRMGNRKLDSEKEAH